MDFLPSSTNSVSSHRLIQITDCHLGATPRDSLLGLDTDQSLRDVLAHIVQEQPQIDAMVCTGDITNGGHGPCYQRFLSITREYYQGPLGWLPGNHDSAETMATLALTERPESRVILLGNWLIILLNSAVPGQVYGELAPSELAFLKATLEANPDKYVMIMEHHQPVQVGSAWIDAYILKNAHELFSLIADYPQVRAIVWGHVHQDCHFRHLGIDLFATPSTSVQFKPGSEDFAVDRQMPGYRWFTLKDDGSLLSGVSRVEGELYAIDYQSGGY